MPRESAAFFAPKGRSAFAYGARGGSLVEKELSAARLTEGLSVGRDPRVPPRPIFQRFTLERTLSQICYCCSLRRPTFSVLPEKVGKKGRFRLQASAERVVTIYSALARGIFYAACAAFYGAYAPQPFGVTIACFCLQPFGFPLSSAGSATRQAPMWELPVV